MKTILIQIALFIGLFITMYAQQVPLSTIVPKTHPRVFITHEDLPEIRLKVKDAPFNKYWKRVQTDSRPFYKAFVGLVNDNPALRKKAAVDYLDELKKTVHSRMPDEGMITGACIYDWCYNEMEPSLREAYIKEFIRIAGQHDPYYPAKLGGNTLVGVANEGWLLSQQLPAGLAIYDESPIMFDAAFKVLMEGFLPSMNFYYQSHMHHQGDSYIGARYEHDMFAAWLLKKMGIKPFSPNQQYVPYQLIYNLRPDGQQMRSGDSYDDSGRNGGGFFPYQSIYNLYPDKRQGDTYDNSGRDAHYIGGKSTIMYTTGAYYNDPYLLEMSDYYPKTDFDDVYTLIFVPRNYIKKPIFELPKSKYFPSPQGELIARTGWNMGVNSNDAVIQMRIGEYFFGNHQCKDFGIFQIYYKGPLAISSGLYRGYRRDHWLHYYHQTISRNGLLIFDPNEKPADESANSGGQRYPLNGSDHPKNADQITDPQNGYKMGTVLSVAIGPDKINPRYNYISGDITNAYAQSKVEKVKRSMLTINTGVQETPAIFVVFDQIISTDPAFKKTWLLHSIEKPTISGRSFTVRRTGEEFSGEGTYGGKLFVQTLLPKDADLRTVGGEGKEFWIESTQTNYEATSREPGAEPGAWRMEVSPKNAGKEISFLHAMIVSPITTAEKNRFQHTDLNWAERVDGENYTLIFSKTDNYQNKMSFTVHKGTKGVFISGLAHGKWKNQQGTTFEVKESENCLFIEKMVQGQLTLTYAGK